MLAVLGLRQQELLRQLLRNKGGLTVVELSERLAITPNAVRQHLAALENDRLVAPGQSRPSGGRPEQLYVLTETGTELFPRHYSWFAQLIVESVKRECGPEAMRQRLAGMGSDVARQLLRQEVEDGDRQQRVEKLAETMEQLGYQTSGAQSEGEESTIEANNCVFHRLAMEDPDICEFDRALLETYTNSAVEHQECMATGGKVCRFRFTPKR